jgi:GT2 family glycosyltransferase
MNGQLTDKISILIKTFERKGSLMRLLHSLQKMYCSLPVFIADDSREPYQSAVLSQFPHLDIRYYTLPFDSGLAAGRNFLLQKVRTPYFLLCDDDFVIGKETQLQNALHIAEQYQLDIAGGAFLNYTSAKSFKRWMKIMLTPSLRLRYLAGTPVVSRHTGHFLINNNQCELQLSNLEPVEQILRCDLVNNFFIGKTASILSIKGWDENFKVGEHEEFFFRVKQLGLKCAFVKGFAVRHYPIATKKYMDYRNRSLEMKKGFPEKYGFSTYKEFDKDTGILIFEYAKDISHKGTKNTKEYIP